MGANNTIVPISKEVHSLFMEYIEKNKDKYPKMYMFIDEAVLDLLEKKVEGEENVGED